MVPAEQDAVADVRRSAVRPRGAVMGFRPGGGPFAGGEPAPAVAGGECLPLAGGEQPPRAAEPERLPVVVELDRQDAGVADVAFGRLDRHRLALVVEERDAPALTQIARGDEHAHADAIRRGHVAAAAADLLGRTLREGEVLGMSWGRSLTAMTANLERLPAISVVQLTGTVGSDLEQSPVEIVRKIAIASGGSAYPVFSPMVVGDPSTADALRRQPDVAKAIRMFDDVTTAVLALGSWEPLDSQLAAFLPDDERAELIGRGVVAEVASTLIAADGQLVAPDFAARSIAIDAERLRRIPRVVLVSSGSRKRDAARAVLRAGLVTGVVTDREIAEALLAETTWWRAVPDAPEPRDPATPPGPMRVAASLWSVPPADRPATARRLVESGLRVWHWDRSDGTLAVPGGFTAEAARELGEATGIASEAHLMLKDPTRELPAWLEFCERIVVHVEADRWRDARDLVRAAGRHPAIAVAPDTAVDGLDLPAGTALLAMSVVPGEAGSPFRQDALGRIAAWAGRHEVGVDGGVSLAHAHACRAAGARWIVSGTALTSAPDAAAWLREAAGA